MFMLMFASPVRTGLNLAMMKVLNSNIFQIGRGCITLRAVFLGETPPGGGGETNCSQGKDAFVLPSN